ncbi:MAG: type II toxin-antitoxin system VapC family toxin [Candidatus Hydrothermarchaeales archaeon]
MRAYIDSNIFIYHALMHRQLFKPCKRILEDVLEGNLDAFTSVLTLTEVYHVISKETDGDKAEQAINAILSLPLEVKDMHISTVILAMRKSENLQIFDRIHLTTAEEYQADCILTNDSDFEKTNLKIIRPIDY